MTGAVQSKHGRPTLPTLLVTLEGLLAVTLGAMWTTAATPGPFLTTMVFVSYL